MLGNLSQFWQLTRELDLNGIRADFEQRVLLAVLGSDLPAAEVVADLLDLDSGSADLALHRLSDWSEVRREAGESRALVVAVIGGALDAASRRALNQLSIADDPLLVVQTPTGAEVLILGVPEERTLVLQYGEPAEAQRERLVDALLRVSPETMLPLSRRNPSLRDVTARHMIRDSARANAQFAAMSSLPAAIPLLGGLVGNAADMLVLTKNQAILLFKLAGLYGRDLSLGAQLLAEVLPVVGSAFVWRTAARSLAGMLPPMVSVVPKAAVAYAGTYVVGEMARYYYLHGRKPPPELVQQMSADALARARGLLRRGQKQ